MRNVYMTKMNPNDQMLYPKYITIKDKLYLIPKATLSACREMAGRA